MSRAFVPILSIACVALACCGKTPPQLSDHVLQAARAGYDAFRAGDQASLDRQIQTLDRLGPSDPTDPAFDGCTSQAFALRRLSRATQGLEHLDDPTILSMSEEARFVYFDRFVADYSREAAGGGAWSCNSVPADPKLLNQDVAVGNSYGAAAEEKERLWLISLRRSFGGQFRPRMANAAHELDVNDIGYQALADTDPLTFTNP
jgi:hypothetical protein